MVAHPRHFSPDTPDIRSKPPLRIGFLTSHNAGDRRAFSGTAYHAARALAAHPGADLRILGPNRAPRLIDRVLRRSAVRIDPDAFDLSGLDVVVGLVATDLLDRTRFPDRLPYLHVTDATPAFLKDHYGWDIPDTAFAAERRVVGGAAATVYSSDWMARLAGGEMPEAGRGRLLSLPFGINFETLPADPGNALSGGRLELLFVGVDWVRKGGETAIAALDRLCAMGIDARLTIVGRCPDRHRRHPGVRDAGFLDKNRPRDLRRLSGLYRRAHLLVLPTQSDCTPMVLAEAMAHGTPVLASDVGGIADLVGGAGAGRLLPVTASARDWAAAIHAMTGEPAGHALMRDAAFERAHSSLTWTAWATGIVAIGEEVRHETLFRVA